MAWNGGPVSYGILNKTAPIAKRPIAIYNEHPKIERVVGRYVTLILCVATFYRSVSY